MTSPTVPDARVVAHIGAEREGFEPPNPCGPAAFKAAAFVHSANVPCDNHRLCRWSGASGGSRTLTSCGHRSLSSARLPVPPRTLVVRALHDCAGCCNGTTHMVWLSPRCRLCTWKDLNLRPPRCKRAALPTELHVRMYVATSTSCDVVFGEQPVGGGKESNLHSASRRTIWYHVTVSYLRVTGLEPVFAPAADAR